MFDFVDFISRWIVPPVSIWFTHYLATRQDKKKTVLATKEERYTRAYLPYISDLYKLYAFKSLGDFCVKNFESRSMFLDLLTNNLRYWDNKTLSLYPAFYKAYLDMLEYEDGNPLYSSAPVAMYNAANEITLAILEEASQLEDSLERSNLSALLLSDYRDEKAKPHKWPDWLPKP